MAGKDRSWCALSSSARTATSCALHTHQHMRSASSTTQVLAVLRPLHIRNLASTELLKLNARERRAEMQQLTSVASCSARRASHWRWYSCMRTSSSAASRVRSRAVSAAKCSSTATSLCAAMGQSFDVSECVLGGQPMLVVASAVSVCVSRALHCVEFRASSCPSTASSRPATVRQCAVTGRCAYCPLHCLSCAAGSTVKRTASTTDAHTARSGSRNA